MKKLFCLLFVVTLFYNFSHAQAKFGKELSLKPFAGAKGIIFDIQSPNPIDFSQTKPKAGLMFRYLITDQISLRVGVSYWRQKQTFSGPVFGGGTQENFVGDTTLIKTNIGIQKSFGYHEKLEPYVAADLLFSFGQAVYHDHYTVTNASSTGNPGSQNGDYTYIDGKDTPIKNIGIMGIAGVNYYLAENFAIGGEIGWSVYKQFWGHLTETNTQKSGNQTTVTNTSTTDKTTFTVTGQGIIRLTITAFIQ